MITKVIRRCDYGYDAPYALVAFAALGAASVVAAIVLMIPACLDRST
jgi:hypothetical protein